MTFGESVKTCFRKYAVFKGRASRSEFWYFTLFNFLVCLLIALLASPIILWNIFSYLLVLYPLYLLYSLVVFLPSLAVSVRRFHDIGKSGWWILVAYVPTILSSVCQGYDVLVIYLLSILSFVLIIALIIFLLTKSQKGENEYGPMPE